MSNINLELRNGSICGEDKRVLLLNPKIWDYMNAPKVPIGARVLAASVTLMTCFLVYQTARRAGELVYLHAVGVKSAPAQVSGIPPAEND